MADEKLRLTDCIGLISKGLVPMDLVKVVNSLELDSDIQKFFNAYTVAIQNEVKGEKSHLSFHEAGQEAEEIVYTSIRNALGSDAIEEYNQDEVWKKALPKLGEYMKSGTDDGFRPRFLGS